MLTSTEEDYLNNALSEIRRRTPTSTSIKENSQKRKIEKFSSKIKSILDILDVSLKKEFEPRFMYDPHFPMVFDPYLATDCFIENVDAFATSPYKTIFPRDLANKYGVTMPSFDKSSTENNKYAVQMVMTWAVQNNITNEYIDGVVGSCDFTIYLKFLELGKSELFNKMVLNDYHVNLNDEENKRFFKYIRENIRNYNIHSNMTTFEHYKNTETMSKDLNCLIKFSKMFFNRDNHKDVLIKLQKEFDEASEIIKAEPISLDDLIDDFPAFEKEDDLIATFDIDYDKENHYLYANSVEMIKKATNTNFPEASVVVQNVPVLTQALICFCIDTSLSMMRRIRTINTCLERFIQENSENEFNGNIANICIVSFGGVEPQMIQKFDNIKNIDFKKLTANGGTHMATGIDMAIDKILRERKRLEKRGVSFYKPLLVIISDGGSDDSLTELAKKEKKLIKEDNFDVTCIGYDIENDEQAKLDLQSLSPDEEIRLADSSYIELYFETLTETISSLNK